MTDMRIVFLIVNQGETYEGDARPFLNLARGCMKTNEISIAFFRSSQLPTRIHYDLRSSIITAEDKNTLLSRVVEFDPDFVIGDDKPLSLQLLRHLKRFVVLSLAIPRSFLVVTQSVGILT